MRLKAAIAVVCVLVLAGCTLPRGAAMKAEITGPSASAEGFAVVAVTRAALPALSRWPATGSPPPGPWPPASTPPGDPVLHPGDKVDVTIWDSQENSLLTSPMQRSATLEAVRVSARGTIFVPYAGEVRVAGLALPEARETVQKAMEPVAPAAQVQLSLLEGSSNTVDLVAGVKRPGRYALTIADGRILSLLAQGGGIDPDLRNPLVRLLRGGRAYEIRAERLLRDPAANVRLRSGDRIVVDQDRRSFTVLGASGNESLVPFPRERLSALEALALSGGLNDSRADPKGLLILRSYPAAALAAPGRPGPSRRDVVFTIDLTTADGLFAARRFAVNPDDTLLATESPVTSAQTAIGLLAQILGLGQVAGNL